MSKNIQSKSAKRAASASPGAKKKRGNNNKKRKLPTTFLDSASLDIVVGPPPERRLYTTPVVSDVLKEVFLDRLVKEIVTPFLRRPDGSKKKKATAMDYRHVMKNGKLVKQMVPSVAPKAEKKDSKSDEDIAANRMWKKRIIVGTNQCLRLLEKLANDDKGQESSRHPALIVLARNIYPPTMLAHVPRLAQQLQIPVLLLPGQASLELGKALKMQRTSIIMFLVASSDQTGNNDEETNPIDSFVEFIKDQMPKQEQKQEQPS